MINFFNSIKNQTVTQNMYSGFISAVFTKLVESFIFASLSFIGLFTLQQVFGTSITSIFIMLAALSLIFGSILHMFLSNVSALRTVRIVLSLSVGAMIYAGSVVYGQIVAGIAVTLGLGIAFMMIRFGINNDMIQYSNIFVQSQGYICMFLAMQLLLFGGILNKVIGVLLVLCFIALALRSNNRDYMIGGMCGLIVSGIASFFGFGMVDMILSSSIVVIYSFYLAYKTSVFNSYANSLIGGKNHLSSTKWNIFYQDVQYRSTSDQLHYLEEFLSIELLLDIYVIIMHLMKIISRISNNKKN